MENRITVFISYTWDDENHKEWVLNLANYLIEKGGLNVLLDQYELIAGKDMNHFMEHSLEISDKVLIILTENYKKKANNREGGAGFEYSMISQNLFELQTRNNKFIPILRNGTLEKSAPTYLKTKIYHSMKKDDNYEIALFELLRVIYEKPKLIKPKIGKIPDFESSDIDPIIAIANDINKKTIINQELNNILDSEKGVELASLKIKELFEKIEQKAIEYSNKTNFNFSVQKDTNLKNIIIYCSGHSVSINWSYQFSNTTKGFKVNFTTWLGNLVLNQYNTPYFPGEEPKKIAKNEYTVDLNEEKEIVWRKSIDLTDTNEDIIKMIFTYLIKVIQMDKEKNFRK
ncbi:hypothetical protein C3B47_03425 [Flavobacterium columnare]|uniref:toll/interleukin-1 receptor domain-containing protein n=1 Tax=Flavobacterium columnare TaxID=996 RepID=UPI000D19A425|nr:toll/interleukin-1 receptor domain-containing protein [Flavobacterium columnare]MBF6651961.1 hypothetical protein [Flavobacterium columnare]MBF6654435.1 hypothetical protein [Flavobacterium columnare]MBF6656996.1 hypothetical protein [Flavobacterium columnare]PTD15121.1 hypothetical protein C6N29_12155 [Flavobacterium columnare]